MNESLARKVEVLEAITFAQTVAIVKLLKHSPAAKSEIAGHIDGAVSLTMGMTITDEQIAEFRRQLVMFAGLPPEVG